MNHRIVPMLTLLALAPSALPQENQATKPVLMRTYKVKPGHVVTFEDVIKKYSAAFRKSGREFYMVWRGMAGDVYEYNTITDFKGLEMFDEPSILTRELGERTSILLSTQLAQAVDGVTQRIWHLHPDQSILGADKFKYAEAAFVGVSSLTAQGQENADQRKIVDALRTTGSKNFLTLHLDFGGDDYLALYLRPVEKVADLGRLPTLTALLGADEAKRISAARAQRRRFRHPYIWQYRAGLSFRKIEGGGAFSGN